MATGRLRAVSCRLIYLVLVSVIGRGFYIDGQERSNDAGLSSFVVLAELSPSSFRISHLGVDVIKLSKVLSRKSKDFGRRISFLTLSSCLVLCCYFLFLTVVMYFLLILSGDIELNPGPGPKFPCGICCKAVKSNQKAIQCDGCDKWFHTRCNSISDTEYSILATSNDSWYCSVCAQQPISESCNDSTSSILPLDLSSSCMSNVSNNVADDDFCTVDKKSLLISHLNIRSILPKMDEIQLNLGNHKNQILGLSETWLSGVISDVEIGIDGFRVFRRDRNRNGGGVLVYVPLGIKCVRRNDLERSDIEALCLQLKLKVGTLILCNVYRPPSAPIAWFDSWEIMVENIVQAGDVVVMLGDFNCDMLGSDATVRRLDDTMSEYNLRQEISGPTRVTHGSQSLIDLLFTSNSDMFVKVGKTELGLSDHCMVYGVIRAQEHYLEKHLKKSVRCWKKCNIDELISDLKSAPWDDMDILYSIDDKWTFWQTLFWGIIDKHVPCKRVRVRKHSLPWITQELRKMIGTRNYLLTKAKKSGNEENWTQYRNMRNHVVNVLRRAKLSYFEQVCVQSAKNPKKMWNELKKLTGGRKNHRVDTLRKGHELFDDNEVIVEEFGRYFSSVNGVSVQDATDNDKKRLDHFVQCKVDFCFESFKEHQVLEVLQGLDAQKATGEDGISAALLRTTAPGISASLTKIFNHTLLCQNLPVEWKSAIVTPVPKGKGTNDLDNYRPVSILPAVSKVLERLVYDQLYGHLQANNILHPRQYGFRHGFSTQDILMALVEEWLKALDDDKLVGSVFLDFSKAFDLVDHEILLKKLECYGVRNKDLGWFSGYLSCRRQKVKVNGMKSNWSGVMRGVPQGSILGPLLFLIYSNDLPSVLTHCQARQYADDTTLSVVDSCSDALQLKLNEDLRKIQEWVLANKLCLNVTKTQLMVLSRKRRKSELNDVCVTAGDHELERAKCVRSLGVFLDDGLKWREHVKELSRKCWAGLSRLKRFRKVLPTTLKKRLYNSLVLPHLDYCCLVWQECSKELVNKLERIQNYGMRIILDQPPLTPTTELRNKLGWTSLESRREYFRTMMLHRVMTGDAPLEMRSLFQVNEDIRSQGTAITRGSKNLFISQANSEFGRRTFAFAGSKVWNRLPLEVRRLKGQAFKSAVTSISYSKFD